MKKLFLLLIAGFFLSSCGTPAQRTAWWENDTMYKNTDHMLFSWFGFKKPTKETGKKSNDQKWWGEAVGAELEE